MNMPTLNFNEFLIQLANNGPRKNRAAIRDFRRDTKGAKTLEEAQRCVMNPSFLQRDYNRKLETMADAYRKKLRDDGLMATAPEIIPGQRNERREARY